jgi:hypothetical protein
MKNITVTLDEKTATWARIYAAHKKMSLSRFLGELLHEKMTESREYEQSMRRFFAIVPRPLGGSASYPNRADVNERKNVR